MLIRPPNEETNKTWGTNNAGAVGRDVMGLGLLAQTLYGHTIRCHVVEINGGQAELGEKWGIPALWCRGISRLFVQSDVELKIAAAIHLNSEQFA